MNTLVADDELDPPLLLPSDVMCHRGDSASLSENTKEPVVNDSA